jgi:Hemagglutinin repeat
MSDVLTNAFIPPVASNVGGRNVTLTADEDITVKASSVVADQDVSLAAQNNVSIVAGVNTQRAISFTQTTESGVLSGGGLGVTYGTRDQSLDQKDTNTSAAASTIGSIGGNIRITAITPSAASGAVAPGQPSTHVIEQRQLLNLRVGLQRGLVAGLLVLELGEGLHHVHVFGPRLVGLLFDGALVVGAGDAVGTVEQVTGLAAYGRDAGHADVDVVQGLRHRLAGAGTAGGRADVARSVVQGGKDAGVGVHAERVAHAGRAAHME